MWSLSESVIGNANVVSMLQVSFVVIADKRSFLSAGSAVQRIQVNSVLAVVEGCMIDIIVNM